MKAIPMLVEVDKLELVEKTNFTKYNKQPHLCIEIPDGGFTLSCRTSEGKKITIAFQPYETGGPPQCVDIKHHTTETKTKQGNCIQELTCFTEGRNTFVASKEDEKPTTLVSVMLAPRPKL